MEKLKILKKKARNGAGEWTSSFSNEQNMNAEVKKLTSSPGWVAASRKMASSTKSPGSSRASTPSNTSSSSRNLKREKKKKKKDEPQKQKKFKMVLEKDEEFEVDYVSPEEEENTEESDSESKPMSEESDNNYSIADEEEEDDMSYIDEGEGSVHLADDFSDIEDDEDIPPLELPESSRDLMIPNHLVLPSLGIYEILRHFRSLLRLSPMLFEDFCAALMDEDTNILLTECYISVLKSILREEDASGSQFGPPDQKDSKDAALSFLDYMTWPEIARAYLESTGEHQDVLKIVKDSKFPRVTIEEKISVMKTLTDIYLSSNKVRDKLMMSGEIRHEEICRACHKTGDLLCCEMCPAVYHLVCCDPPLDEIPDDEWQCEVCRAHKLNGVHNCEPAHEDKGQYLRHETIGIDRHGNKYWFLVRRLIVEGVDGIRYYSTQEQFEALRAMLDPDRYEIILCEALKDVAEEFPKYSNITLELTEEALPDNKSTMYLIALQARMKRELEQKRERLREEARKKQEEERKRKEEEEATKRQEEKRKAEEDQRRKREEEDQKKKWEEAENNEGSGSKLAESSDASKLTENSEGMVQTGQHLPTSSNDSPDEVEPSIPTVGDQSSTPVTDPAPMNLGLQPVTPVDFPPASDQSSVSVTSSGSVSTVPQPLTSARLTPMTPSSVVTMAMPKIVTSSIVTTPQIVVPGQARNIQVIKLGQNLPMKPPQAVGQPTQLKTLYVLNKDGTRTPITLGPAGKLLTPGIGNSQSSANRQILVLNSAKVALPKVSRELKKLQFTGAGPKTVDLLNNQTSTDHQPTVHQLRQRTPTSNATFEPVKEMPTPPPVIVKKELTHQEEAELYFRLGEDKGYRQYQNHFTENPLALNKGQHKEERDRERYLSYKFSLSGEGEFKWMGETLGSEATMLGTIRSTLLHLEHQIPLCFMHTKWDRYRNAWGKMVMTCNTPQGFAAALGILEMATRVVVKRSVWRNSHGLPRLKRVTIAEKEEWDKKRKHRTRAEEEESNRNAIWCKYPFPIKCTLVWKVRGEEYRMTGYGGWMWVSTTRLSKLRPVRPKPHTLVHDERKRDTATKEVKPDSNESEKKEPVICDLDTDSENSASTTSTSTTISTDLTEERGVFEALVQEAANQPKLPIVKPSKTPSSSSFAAMETEDETSAVKSETVVTSQFDVKHSCDKITGSCDVINVSENLLKRTPLYNKKWSASRIDILLGWRMLQKGKDKPAESSAISVSNTAKPVTVDTKPITVTTDVNKPTDVTMAASIAEMKSSTGNDAAAKPVATVTGTVSASANLNDKVSLPTETKPISMEAVSTSANMSNNKVSMSAETKLAEGVNVTMATTPTISNIKSIERTDVVMDGVLPSNATTITGVETKLPTSDLESDTISHEGAAQSAEKMQQDETDVVMSEPSAKDPTAPHDGVTRHPTSPSQIVSDVKSSSDVMPQRDTTTTPDSLTKLGASSTALSTTNIS